MYCLSLGTKNIEKALKLIAGYDLAEIRLDLTGFGPEEISALCKTHGGLIFTYRKKQNIDDKQRLDYLLHAIDQGAAYIDIDIQNETDFIRKVRNKISDKQQVKLITSFHDYEYTPVNSLLYDQLLKMSEFSPDLIKLVCTSHGTRDNLRILYFNSSFNNVIAFNMGEKGSLTRLFCLEYGAPFTYVCNEDHKTAPGQWSKTEMMNYYNQHRKKGDHETK